MKTMIQKALPGLGRLLVFLLPVLVVQAQSDRKKPVNLLMEYQSAAAEHKNYFTIRDAFDKYWKSLNSKGKLTEEQQREYKLYYRWDTPWMQRMQGSDGDIKKYQAYEDSVRYRIWLDEQKAQRNIPQPNCPAWRPIGPDTNAYSNFYGVGRVNKVAFHKNYHAAYAYGQTPPWWDTEANTMFAASRTGGLWKSINGGRNWFNLNTDFLPRTGVADFEFSSYHENEIYLVSSFQLPGTEQEGGHGSGVIYRSEDGGNSWTGCGAPFNDNFSTYSSNRKTVRDLEILAMPGYSEFMFVASEDGIHRSTNKGVNWSQRCTAQDLKNNFVGGPSKIILDPHDRNRLYLSGDINWTNGVNGWDCDSIFYSDNAGSHWNFWKRIEKSGSTAGTLALGLPASITGVLFVSGYKILISTLNPNKMYVFVNVVSQSSSAYSVFGQSITPGLNNLTYVFKSNDRGNTWTRTLTASLSFSYLGLEIDPNNDERIYAYHSKATASNNLRYSNDGGATWTLVSPPSHMHADLRHLVCRNIYSCGAWKTYLLTGSDGGLNLCTDGANLTSSSTWTNVTGKGLQIAEIYKHDGSPQQSDFLTFGAQDNGSWHRRNATFQGWRQIIGGDGMDCAYDFNDPTVFYTSDNLNSNLNRNIYNVNTGAISSSGIRPGNASNPYWVAPIQLNPMNSRTVFAGYGNCVYRSKGWISTGSASNWVQSNISSSGVPAWGNQQITTLGIAPTDSNRLFASSAWLFGTTHNRVVRSVNGGQSWTNSGAWWTCFVSGFAISASSPDLVFASQSGHEFWNSSPSKVKMSMDGGQNWSPFGAGLYDVPVNCIMIDELCGYIYVGTDYGVYRSKVGAGNWQRYGCGLPNAIVNDISFTGTGSLRKIRVSTFGRGIWEADIPCQ